MDLAFRQHLTERVVPKERLGEPDLEQCRTLVDYAIRGEGKIFNTFCVCVKLCCVFSSRSRRPVPAPASHPAPLGRVRAPHAIEMPGNVHVPFSHNFTNNKFAFLGAVRLR